MVSVVPSPFTNPTVYHLSQSSAKFTGTRRASVDIDVNANLELVDKFCYLGDMLSEDGDADAAVENRIRIAWNKFRQLVPLLTNNNISLIMSGILYSTFFLQCFDTVGWVI